MRLFVSLLAKSNTLYWWER